MSFDQEALRGEVAQRPGAIGNLEQAVTTTAVEVVMVTFAGYFPAHPGDTWDVDRMGTTFTLESRERAVDRGDAETWYECRCAVADLAGRKRSATFVEHPADRPALLGSPHGGWHCRDSMRRVDAAVAEESR